MRILRLTLALTGKGFWGMKELVYSEKLKIWDRALAKAKLLYKRVYVHGDCGPAIIKADDLDYPIYYLFFNDETEEVELRKLQFDELYYAKGDPDYITTEKRLALFIGGSNRDIIHNGIMSTQADILLPSIYDEVGQVGINIYLAASYTEQGIYNHFTLYRGKEVVAELNHLENSMYALNYSHDDLVVLLDWDIEEHEKYKSATCYFIQWGEIFKLSMAEVLGVYEKNGIIQEINCRPSFGGEILRIDTNNPKGTLNNLELAKKFGFVRI